MIGDLLILSPETVSSKLAECKDGEDIEISVSGKVMLHNGSILLAVDPASVEKSGDYAAPETDPAGMKEEMSPGATAILSRGK